MSNILKLHGYEKETFAVIFGFWIKSEGRPVRAPLSVIQTITGGSRPAIARAVAVLAKKKLILAVEQKPGKPTLYSVTIPSEIIDKFKATYRQKLVEPVDQKELKRLTTTSSKSLPQNKKNGKNQTDTTLRVRKPSEITTGGLPEAK